MPSFEQPASGHKYPFELASKVVDRAYKPVARFHCTKCPVTIDFGLASQKRLNPELIVSWVKQQGWHAINRSPNQTLCPDCLTAKRSNDTDSELKKFEARMSNNQPRLNGTADTVLQATTPPPVVAIREPTTEARAQIRTLLEKHFDADDGCYLDGWTDNTIAEEVRVPRVIVERLRDAAYGPIRITPEMQKVRGEIAEAYRQIADVQSAAEALIEQVGSELRKLRATVSDLEGRVKSMKAAA